MTIRDISGRTLNNRTVTVMLPEGGMTGLTATVFPNGDAGALLGVKWTSSNAKIASIDSATGEITFMKAGTVTIKAIATDGTGKSVSFKLTIKNG